MSLMQFESLARSLSFRVDEVRCSAPKGERSPPEASVSWELVFVRSGHFVIESRDQDIPMTSNHVLLFVPGDEFAVRHPNACGDTCLSVSLPTESLIGMDIASSEELMLLRQAPMERRRIPSESSRFLAQQRLSGSGGASEHNVVQLFGETLRELIGRRPAAGKRRVTRGRHHQLVSRVIEHIISRPLDDTPRLAEIAKDAGVSIFHLARVFKRETGSSIHSYLVALKLREAVGRLADGEPSLTALAHALGFSDHSHFSSSFRRKFGCSPSQFRRELTRRA